MRLPVTGHAGTALLGIAELAADPETYWSDEDGALRLLGLGFDGRDLTLADDVATLDAAARALVDLANGEDDVAEQRNQKTDPEIRRYARASCAGLGTLATKCWRRADELRRAG